MRFWCCWLSVSDVVDIPWIYITTKGIWKSKYLVPSSCGFVVCSTLYLYLFTKVIWRDECRCRLLVQCTKIVSFEKAYDLMSWGLWSMRWKMLRIFWMNVEYKCLNSDSTALFLMSVLTLVILKLILTVQTKIITVECCVPPICCAWKQPNRQV